MKTEERQTIAVYKYQLEVLRKIAKKNYRSVTGQVRFIIEEWLEKNK